MGIPGSESRNNRSRMLARRLAWKAEIARHCEQLSTEEAAKYREAIRQQKLETLREILKHCRVTPISRIF